MSYEINLDEVDVDGAVREAADEVSGDTRLGFLKKAGLGGGAAMSGGAVLSALAPSAFAASQKGRPPAKFGKGDIGILNYALTLEYLEAAFYNGATAAKLSLSPQAAAFLKIVTEDENAHVKFLKKALGSKAAKEPKFNFAGANTSAETFMKTAAGAGEHGRSRLPRAGAEHQEPGIRRRGRLDPHDRGASRQRDRAAQRSSPTGAMIAPDGPFDKPWTAGKVLKEVEETKFIVG